MFAGYDQHIFHVPSVVEFGNGSTVVVPQLGTYPNILDYEICDPAIGGQACDQALFLRQRRSSRRWAGHFMRNCRGIRGL